jgi:HPt (histidine-containing phosphotransfer) domain-containing protein
VEEAHARLDLSRAALDRLLGRFAQGLPAALASLSAAVAAGDHDAVRAHAHSLSGSAGTLAVHRLRWAAAALEAAGRAHAGPLEKLLAVVEAEAMVVLGSLSSLTVVEQPTTGDAPAPGRLAELHRCLVAGDLSGITDELATLSSAGGERLGRLRALIADYEYERAAALIEGAL